MFQPTLIVGEPFFVGIPAHSWTGFYAATSTSCCLGETGGWGLFFRKKYNNSKEHAQNKAEKMLKEAPTRLQKIKGTQPSQKGSNIQNGLQDQLDERLGYTL